MQKRNNTYYFSVLEKNILKKLIDKKYGKKTSPADYDSTGGEYDTGIEGHIKECTGKQISGSTLERLVGLREKETSGVSISTLEIVSQYVNFENIDKLIKYIDYYSYSNLRYTKQFDIVDLIKQFHIKICFNNMSIILKLLNDNIFEVISSNNSILINGDKLYIEQLKFDEELICYSVLRKSNNKIIPLGYYKSGINNLIKSIKMSN